MKAQKRKISRRQFLGALGASGMSCALYMRIVEPYWLDITIRKVRLFNTPLTHPIRLLHLSDLHYSKSVSLSFLEKSFIKGLSLKPHLICITGDFVTRKIKHRAAYRSILSLLSDSTPTFAIIGNHDGGAWVGPKGGYHDSRYMIDFLTSCNIGVLHNQQLTVTIKQQSLKIVGVGDLWAKEMNPKLTFSHHNATKTPVIAMAHNPDSKEVLKKYPWDLLLCGHTHGGQLRIPAIGTPFAPVQDHRYVKGLHQWQGRYLHISKGIGNILGMRLNCRPEINLIELT